MLILNKEGNNRSSIKFLWFYIEINFIFLKTSKLATLLLTDCLLRPRLLMFEKNRFKKKSVKITHF